MIDVGWAQEGRIKPNVLARIEAGVSEGRVDKIACRVTDSHSDDVIPRLRILKHEPHGANVVAGETPVAPGIQISQHQLVGQAQLDASHPVTHLSWEEFQPSAR